MTPGCLSCGECCTHIRQYIGSGDLEWATAHGMVWHTDEEGGIYLRHEIPCLHYEPSGAHHCRIYEVRPLTCYLYACPGARRRAAV